MRQRGRRQKRTARRGVPGEGGGRRRGGEGEKTLLTEGDTLQDRERERDSVLGSNSRLKRIRCLADGGGNASSRLRRRPMLPERLLGAAGKDSYRGVGIGACCCPTRLDRVLCEGKEADDEGADELVPSFLPSFSLRSCRPRSSQPLQQRHVSANDLSPLVPYPGSRRSCSLNVASSRRIGPTSALLPPPR